MARKGRKWFQVDDDEPRHVTRIVELPDEDEPPPPLEEVDLETGSVVSTIFSDPQVATAATTAARAAPPRKLIEVIGGDDMEGLD